MKRALSLVIIARHAPSLFSLHPRRMHPYARLMKASYNPNAIDYPHHSDMGMEMHATTILTVRKDGDVVVIGDGQVSIGSTIVKPNARKVRVIGNGKVVCGFAGATADCFTLLEQLEKKVEEFPGQLLRAVVELAKMWRTDKFLRHLEALVIVCDPVMSITLTGNGDVLSEPQSGVMGIGSGGLYAVSAAKALVAAGSPLTAREIALHAMNIAADVCVYTNREFVIEAFEKGQLITGEEKKKRESQDLNHAAVSHARKLVRQEQDRTSNQDGATKPPTPATSSKPIDTTPLNSVEEPLKPAKNEE